jgi:prepilin-type N-terminal cleavage/methylation domain-containing protein
MNLRDDRGFSLSELLVTLALIGVVLAVTFGALQAVYASRDVAERQARFAREVGGPLLSIEKFLMQTLQIKSFDNYSITFVTDADNNNSVEWHEISIATNGTLTQRSWLTTGAQVKSTQTLNATWSQQTSNRATGIAFVQVFDKDNQRIYTTAGAKSIVITIEVEERGRRFRDQRTILLRNL